jgi:hypothetical protein
MTMALFAVRGPQFASGLLLAVPGQNCSEVHRDRHKKLETSSEQRHALAA